MSRGKGKRSDPKKELGERSASVGEADFGGLKTARQVRRTKNIATTLRYRALYAYDDQNTATGSFRAQQ